VPAPAAMNVTLPPVAAACAAGCVHFVGVDPLAPQVRSLQQSVALPWLEPGDMPGRTEITAGQLVIHGVNLDASASLALIDAYTPLSVTLDRFDAWAQRMRLVPRPLVLEPT
jgi:hypothetical protein